MLEWTSYTFFKGDGTIQPLSFSKELHTDIDFSQDAIHLCFFHSEMNSCVSVTIGCQP